ncbi:hypothetical protein [Streptomyces sp. CA-111067]|uniref:hypothetical protein n=1 Tax=Streptomyces sp. CA-111067 TaxID=3240046 RepID=UPI003D962331
MPALTAVLAPTRTTVRAPDRGRGADLRRRLRVPLIATAAVLPLYALWVVCLATGGGDLAAQDAWAEFVGHHPGSAYNLSWYGGLHTAGYSLVSPYLMAWFGVRTVSVLSGLAGSWLAAALFVRSGMHRPLWPALFASLALWCNVASGRTTFALGVALGLGAVLVVTGPNRRPLLAVTLSALATAGSPVAGLFLGVAGAGLMLARHVRDGVALALPPFLVVAATVVFFPSSGQQPMSFGRIWPPVMCCAAVVLCAPLAWRTLRFGAVVYAVGVVLTFLVPSPIGTNVERLAELVGPAVLVACLLAPGRYRLQRLALVAALAVSVNWLAQKTVDDLNVSTDVPSWAAHSQGVVTELRVLGADKARVEVVPVRDHREATLLAPYVNMARGWNRQIDMKRGRLFYDGTFSAASYRAWLDSRAVGFVVLSSGKPDDHAGEEAALVNHPPSWLTPVWRDANWRIYRVHDPQPLVSGDGTVISSDSASLVVRVSGPGAVIVRIAYSPWLHATGACLRPAGDWAQLIVPTPGDYRITSQYRLPGAPC